MFRNFYTADFIHTCQNNKDMLTTFSEISCIMYDGSRERFRITVIWVSNFIDLLARCFQMWWLYTCASLTDCLLPFLLVICLYNVILTEFSWQYFLSSLKKFYRWFCFKIMHLLFRKNTDAVFYLNMVSINVLSLPSK